VSERAEYLHCPITKAASTFFHRLLLTTVYVIEEHEDHVDRPRASKGRPLNVLRGKHGAALDTVVALPEKGNRILVDGPKYLKRHLSEAGEERKRNDGSVVQQDREEEFSTSSFTPLSNSTDHSPNSPFRFNILSDAPLPRPKFHELGIESTKLSFLSRALKSVFVRDPWWRMFSAYVDKAFAPNPTFWRQWGKGGRTRVKRRGRVGMPGGGRHRYAGAGWTKKCVKDVSFTDVLELAAKSLKHTDLHFMTVSKLCQPCHFRYDLVGKMETFPHDLHALAAALHLPATRYLASDAFWHDYARDAIEDSVHSPWRWKRDIASCGMNSTELALRVWRKLQIRGLIDRRLPLPLKESALQATTAEDMVRAALEAHHRSTDRAALKEQKVAAFREAYRTVNLGVLNNLQQHFAPDFELFAYEPNNTDIFDRERALTLTGAFDWWRPWGEGQS
jgi:hypothetical protein